MVRNPSFWYLWGGQATSNFGDRLYMIAIITFIYKQTDSALLAASVPFIRMGMQLLSSLLTPLITQKISLKCILAFSQLIQSALLVSLILFLSYIGNSFFFIVTIVTLLSFLHSWVAPLKNALLPQLVGKDKLVKANNIVSITDQTFALFGWVGGGVLISKIGPIAVLWSTVTLFLLSSGLFFLIPSLSVDMLRKSRFSWGLVIDGWRYVMEKPMYRRIFLVGMIQSLAGSVWVGAIILVFVKKILHQNESWWGYLNGAWLFGTIVGGVLLSRWIQSNLESALEGGLWLNGIMVFFYAGCSISTLTLIVAFFIGVPYQVYDIAKRTLLQVNAEKERLAQIFAAYHAVGSVSFGVGIFFMNLIVDVYSVQWAYSFAAVITLLAAWVARGMRKGLV